MDYLKAENLWESIRELEGEIRWNPLNAGHYFELGVFNGYVKDGEQAWSLRRVKS